MLKKTIKEFKEFALKGNVVDMAVGVMVGGAFGKIVSSLVNDMFMPLISLLTGGIKVSDWFLALDGNTYATVEAAQAAGASTLNYGVFLQAIIDFFLMALCVFIVVKLMNRVLPKKPAPEKPRLCPFCKGEIDKEATRCPHCTSQLEGPEQN